MEELNGRWLMDKHLSSGIDEMLKLQGISWFLRQGVKLATVHLEISTKPDEASNGIIIDCLGIPTGGLPSTREVRVTDWAPKDQSEFLFGNCQHMSSVVHGAVRDDGKVFPEFELQVDAGEGEETARKFLRGEILEDGRESEWAVNEGGEWVHSFVRNCDSKGGWTSEQIWGFEMVDGKRCHTRRVVVATASKEYAMGRTVYSLTPKTETDIENGNCNGHGHGHCH